MILLNAVIKLMKKIHTMHIKCNVESFFFFEMLNLK